MNAAEYLHKVLTWKKFTEGHKLFAKAIKDVLFELYYLRDKVNRLEAERENNGGK